MSSSLEWKKIVCGGRVVEKFYRIPVHWDCPRVRENDRNSLDMTR